ncbi:transmembrane protein, putative [Medicago truncatula]|uniref:Transmembrane protein, putative n=1 Tax=Medicago truncatula TaxID=3880 RepID=G7ITZ0_MEDTR|nr:transmembrane protein, putative [Medicago truncatula]
MGLVGGTLSDLIMHPNKSIWTLIGDIIIRLITEILLGYVLLLSRIHSRFATYQQALRISSFVMLTIGLIGKMVLFLKGVPMSDHCLWGHRLK